VIRQNKQQTQGQSNWKRNEVWTVVINKNQYSLKENEAKILQDAIASGSRGIVLFKDFSISIPYIEEFYLDSVSYEQPLQLGEPEYSEEKMENSKKRLAELKKNLKFRTF
jgi:hypothetical protein